MIICHMDGRLGNQLFRYALARKISLQTGQEIVYDFTNVYKKGWKNDLLGFCCECNEAEPPKSLSLLCQKARLNFYRLKRNLILRTIKTDERRYQDAVLCLKYAKKLAKHGIFYIAEGYYPFDSYDHKDILLHGMFESKKYFDDIKDVLIRDLSPKEPCAHNDEAVKRIQETNSVCVTIRRGDFLDEAIAKTHLVCDIDYYKNAVELMKEKIKDPVFFVFSDDIEWVKAHIDFPEGSFFESGNDPVAEKLRVMRECKHFILSNSTFSWWCQYLSPNPDKVVISPSVWSKCKHITDLIDEDWILI